MRVTLLLHDPSNHELRIITQLETWHAIIISYIVQNSL